MGKGGYGGEVVGDVRTAPISAHWQPAVQRVVAPLPALGQGTHKRRPVEEAHWVFQTFS
jgi:hypothetical protein